MTGTTANYGFSYPQGTDLVTNGAAAIQTLAEGVDTALFNTPSSYRNLLINGHMQVWQRATDVAGITGFGYYTADRWRWDISTFGTWRHTQDTGAVPANTMFSSSLRMIATTARPSPSSTNSARLQQRVEGQNLQAVMKGKTSAKPLTLSFWGNVPVAGTMIVELEDVTNGRFCSAAVVFSAANSWEYKTVTFPADTTGTWPNTNALALQLNFWLGAGSSYTSGTLGTTWHTTTANRAVGQTNFAATTNWTTYITGVQLEVGSVATPFQFESISETISKCQRYYEKSYDIQTNPGTANTGGSYWARLEERMADGAGTARFFAHVNFKQQKRTSSYTPTIYSQAGTVNRVTLNRAGNSGTAGYYNLYVAASANSAYNTGTADIGEGAFTLQAQTTWLPSLSFATFHWVADAEL